MRLQLLHNKKSGFTLIELVVYIGIAVLLLSLIGSLYIALTQARVKHQIMSEVEAQGLQAMSVITQSIRNADSITTPALAGTGTSLSLATSNIAPVRNPTVFTLSSGLITMTEGTGSAVPLTTPTVVVSGLTFQNVSRANTSGSVKVQFTVGRTVTGRYERTYSKTFYGSGTVRDIFQ
jgi:Tfp pilus assembly protein PilW